jgi:hypothetical protein
MYFNPSTGGDILATAQNMLITCPALRVLILTPTMTRDRDIGSVPSIDDNRFVHMKTLLVDYRNGWLVHPRGGVDCWARADAFVEKKKRRGEIQPNRSTSLLLCFKF